LSKPQARNDIESAVPKFCFGLEVHRRTPDGRVRTAKEFLAHFFPHDKKSSTDRIFHYLPNEVRAPILTTWGVRGKKSALMDDDAKVQSVMHDALVAGDVDASMFEDALSADTIMRWIDLSDWWTFWRGGKITKFTILKALESGYDLGLFDADWFLESIRGQGGKLRGTDVLAEGLNKADLTEWVRRVHESGDGSPKGLLSALGWDQIVAKTTDEVLVSVLDAMATKVSLGAAANAKPDTEPPAGESKAGELKVGDSPKPGESKPDVKVEAKADGKPEATLDPKPETGADAKPAANVDGKPLADFPPQAETKAPLFPGILVPSSAVATDRFDPAPKAGERAAEDQEEAIDSESAANLFKDDELIPISSGAWDDVDGDDRDTTAVDRKRGSKPPRNSRGAK
jgi:hypothetical protein